MSILCEFKGPQMISFNGKKVKVFIFFVVQLDEKKSVLSASLCAINVLFYDSYFYIYTTS